MALVCWSGGCDSTLVLYDLAQKASPLDPVRAVSFDVSQTFMRKEQALARKRILAWMKKKGLHVDHFEIGLNTGIKGNYSLHSYGNPQAVLWLLATQALTKEEDLYMGFVRKDDWWGDYASWHLIFTTLQDVAGRAGKLRTPLCKTHKHNVVARLREIGLLDLTWWCGADDLLKNKRRREPCGYCNSCVDHETAVWQHERFGRFGLNRVKLKEK